MASLPRLSGNMKCANPQAPRPHWVFDKLFGCPFCLDHCLPSTGTSRQTNPHCSDPDSIPLSPFSWFSRQKKDCSGAHLLFLPSRCAVLSELFANLGCLCYQPFRHALLTATEASNSSWFAMIQANFCATTRWSLLSGLLIWFWVKCLKPSYSWQNIAMFCLDWQKLKAALFNLCWCCLSCNARWETAFASFLMLTHQDNWPRFGLG